ncbi:chaperone DnaJ [Anaeramoeba flamelloides]|uniref:Chaperone DnaJ n=1 Tax=Anaeramoeba flamelloides TaxID=1746091 RepID=A0ABQ8YCU3_9EUKA|nr:chaperone DnaJ [Anaeramoeba flamelloides]
MTETKETKETKEIKETKFFDQFPELKTINIIFPAHMKEVLIMFGEMYETFKESVPSYIKTLIGFAEKIVLLYLTLFSFFIKTADTIVAKFLGCCCCSGCCHSCKFCSKIYGMTFKILVDKVKGIVDEEIENKNDDEDMCPKIVEYANSTYKLIDMILPEPEEEQEQEQEQEEEENVEEKEQVCKNNFWTNFWLVVRYYFLILSFFVLRMIARHGKKKECVQKCKYCSAFFTIVHELLKTVVEILKLLKEKKCSESWTELTKFKTTCCDTIQSLFKKSEEEEEEEEEEEKKEK